MRSRTRAFHGAAMTALLVSLAACSWVPTPFQRAAEDAASTFSSASVTLRFEHPETLGGETRLTREYAAAAFVNYAESVTGVDEELGSAAGAPSAGQLDSLLAAVKAAAEVVGQPCLDDQCDWAGQIGVLEAARTALLAAAR